MAYSIFILFIASNLVDFFEFIAYTISEVGFTYLGKRLSQPIAGYHLQKEVRSLTITNGLANHLRRT